MQVDEAIALLGDGGVETRRPTTWADLGCGDGTFTRALASLLAAGSTIHAMDRQASLLRALPSSSAGADIHAHRGDFTRRPWPFADPDGILMANSLHYVAAPAAFLRACVSERRPRFLIVEYDTDRASQWVPYPVGRARLQTLFAAAGFASIRILGVRPSIYRRAPLYAAAIALDATS
jgi:SAM-dependent methyltransferase